MAQHAAVGGTAYVIANQSGSSFRADVNNLFQAILSSNSGSTAPTPTLAGTLWADTGTNTIKIRDSSNSSWITIGKIDSGAIEFGTSEIVFNESGADYNFRIEGDTNTNLVVVDASADKLGIGTATPGTVVEIDDAAPYVTLKNSTGEDTDGGRESRLIFEGEQSGGEITTLAQIEVSHDGSSDDQKGKLVISTNDGSDGASPTAAITIDSTQKVTLGGSLAFGPAAGDVFDYEEGTFTPVISSSGATTPGTSDIVSAYDYQLGRYSKIGNHVFFEISIKPDSTYWIFQNGGATGQSLYVGGLPYTSYNGGATSTYGGACISSYVFTSWTASYEPMAYVEKNSTFLGITYGGNANSSTAVLTTNFSVSGVSLIMHGHYEVA